MKLRLTIATVVLALPAIASAHHGWSTYDEEKPIRVTAALRDVTWNNPHSGAKINWQNKTWNVVMAPIARMEARGLTPAMLSAGKPVVLQGQVRKDGTAEMKIDRLTLDGKAYELR